MRASCGGMMGVIVRFPDRGEKKPSREHAELPSEERFQFPGPDVVSEISCEGPPSEQARGKAGPEDSRAAR